MKQTIWTLALILFTAYSLTGCDPMLTPLPLAPTEPPVPPSTSAPTAVPSETTKPSDTPSPIPISETVAPSEIPQLTPPTNTPTPFVKITSPRNNGTLSCDNPPGEPFCLFHVQGTIVGVDSPSTNYFLFVIVCPVDPHGAGAYLQRSPAAINSNGNWQQAPAYLGNVTYPAKEGNTLWIQAVLVKRDATFHDQPLVDLVTSESKDEIILPAANAIVGIVAVSDIIKLVVGRRVESVGIQLPHLNN